MSQGGKSVVRQFALAAAAVGLLWFGVAWAAPFVIRGLLGWW